MKSKATLILTWKVLSSLLNEMKKKFDKEIIGNQIKGIRYYYLSPEMKDRGYSHLTLGSSLQKKISENDKEKGKERVVAENSIYKRIYLPVKREENESFSTRRGIYPNVFFEYIGCSGIENFLQRCREGIYRLSMSAIEEQETLLNENKKNEEIESIELKKFSCYFSDDKENVREAILNVEFETKTHNPKKATLTSFSNYGDKNHYKSISINWGEYISIALKDDSIDNGYILLSIYKGTRGIPEGNLMHGVYSGFNPSNKPVCGEMLMRAHSNATDIHVNIQDYLTGKRITSQRKVFRRVEQLVDKTDNNLVAEYLCGTYVCFLIEDNNTINKASLTINPNGSVIFKSGSKITYNCELQLFNYRRYAVITGRGTGSGFCFQFVFNTLEINGGRLIGTHSGIGPNIIKPKAGRIVALHLNNEKEFSDLEVRYIDIKSEEYTQLERSILTSYQWNLTSFLSGKLDGYIDNVVEVFLPIESSKINSGEKSNDVFFKDVSEYELYFLSSKKRKLRKYMLKLDRDGTAYLKGRNNYWGNFHRSGINLIINIGKEKDKPIAQLICFVGESSSSYKIMGTYCSVTDNGSPYSMLCILIKKGSLKKQTKNITEYSALNKEITYDNFEYNDSGIEIGGKEFHELDEQYNGLATFLSDKYANTVKTRRILLELDERIESDIIISEKIFNSACYYAMIKQPTEKIEEELKLCYDSGYNNLIHIQNECQKGKTLDKYKDFIYRLWKIKKVYSS